MELTKLELINLKLAVAVAIEKFKTLSPTFDTTIKDLELLQLKIQSAIKQP